MALLDWTQLATVANADGEFRLLARFWNAAIRLDIHHRCAYYPAVRRLVELMREMRLD